MAKRSSKTTKRKYPERSSDLLVNQAMLYGVRDELKSYIHSQIHDVRSDVHSMKADMHAMQSDIHAMKSDIHATKSDIHAMQSDIHGMKSDIHGMKSDIHEIKSEMHRVALLVEEQNARNAIVFDGLTSLFTRQERVESELSELRRNRSAGK